MHNEDMLRALPMIISVDRLVGHLAKVGDKATGLLSTKSEQASVSTHSVAYTSVTK